MSDLVIGGSQVSLLSREQLAHYDDGEPGWTLRVLEKLSAREIHFGWKLVVFTADGNELEFAEVGHA